LINSSLDENFLGLVNEAKSDLTPRRRSNTDNYPKSFIDKKSKDRESFALKPLEI
jgi:hypothetical protein